ncbi:MAG: hypothetical protein HONBIEJF_00407 [Fimbriimonadaceae bacterium]|nr:hypothetical protein [Fimbriimonadaceae bacterium]
MPYRNSVPSLAKRIWPSLLFIAATTVVWAGTTVDLRYQRFDPLKNLPRIAQLRTSQMENLSGPQTYLVQFDRSLNEADRAAVEAVGGELLTYIPEHTWIVRAGAADYKAIKNLEFVRWVGLYEAPYKVSNEIGVRRFKNLDRALEQASGRYELVISVLDGVSEVETASAAHAIGMEILEIDAEGRSILIRAKGNLNQVSQLAEHQDVLFIDEASEVNLRNDLTRWVIQSNVSGQQPIWDKGIHGEGQIGGLIDGRMYMNHDQFRDPVNNTPGPNHRKVVAYLSSNGQGSDSHGTHTAGTFAGDRIPINGQTFRNGMAYAAKLAFRNLSDINGSNLLTRLNELHANGARVHSNSWGDDGTTSYTSWCRAIDEYSWNNEEGCVAFAVTNLSTLKTPENAKSCLAVGASQQANSQQNHGSGGTGPTADGRRKPEIYSPGVNIWSALAGTTSSWTQMTGTSMACPSISGGSLLVRQYYMEGWLETGAKNPAKGFTPSGALIRSTIMNAGVDMTGISGYPSNREGWGRLLLDNALYFAGDAARLLAYDRRNGNGMTAGQEDTYYIAVRNPSVPLKIVMTFTDFPGAVNAGNPVVNDMNLTVVGPTGTTWLGNDFNTSTGESKTGGAVDAKNSTEVVLLKVPAKGLYRVKVKCQTLNNGTKQGYALTVSGGVLALTNQPVAP